MRSIAVKAGERVSTQEDRDNLADKCRQYKACKQMKKRRFRNERLGAIEDACHGNSPEFWKIIDKICPQSAPANEPTEQEFVEYFQKLSLPQSRILMTLWKIMRSVSCKECPKIINIILIVILKTRL